MLFSQQLTHSVLLKAAWAHNPRGIADIPGAARAPVRCSSLELPQTKYALSVVSPRLNEQVTYVTIHTYETNHLYSHWTLFALRGRPNTNQFLNTHTMLDLLH